MAEAPSPRAAPPASTSARGRMSRQVAGTETVEVKATIATANIGAGMKYFGLTANKAQQRFIYFFDTAKLDLFRSGVIVRARRIPSEPHDSTVKMRPVEPKRVPEKWRGDKGFKVEADASEKSIVCSASLTRGVAKGAIKRVAAGEESIAGLLDEHQKQFLTKVCRVDRDLDKLRVLGPISSLWWKFSHPGLPGPMTAELWTREDGETMLEASIRVPVEQAAFANAGFLAFLEELGAERDNAQQAKTRWALEFHASQLGASGKAKAKAKKDATKSAPADARKKAKPRDAAAVKAPARSKPAAARSKPRTAIVAEKKTVAKRPVRPAAKTPPPPAPIAVAEQPIVLTEPRTP